MKWKVTYEQGPQGPIQTIVPEIKEKDDLQELTRIIDFILACKYVVRKREMEQADDSPQAEVEDNEETKDFLSYNVIFKWDMLNGTDDNVITLVIYYPQQVILSDMLNAIHSAAHYLHTENELQRQQMIFNRIAAAMQKQGNIYIPKPAHNPGLKPHRFPSNTISINKLKGDN